MEQSLSPLQPFFTIPQHGDLSPGLTHALTAVSDARNLLTRQERRVVFFGALKSGKSSLLTALLGNVVLPARVHASSGAVATIRYGLTPTATLMRGTLPSQTIPIGHIAETMLSDTGPDWAIDELQIEIPHPLLAHHGVLVDTPGLNGDKAFTERTHGEIERADLGVMVLAADKILSARERDFARWATDMLNGNVIYVVNRLDLIDSDDREEVLEWTHDALRDSGNNLVGQPRIFAVSSKLYEGIAEFGWWLTQLLASDAANQMATLSRLGVLESHLHDVHHQLTPHLDEARRAVHHARDEHDAAIVCERAAIRGEIAQARVRLRRVTDGLPALGERFVERCVEATRRSMEDGSERRHRVPVQYRAALVLYVEDIASAARDALIGSPITTPAFDLSGWIVRDWVDPATHVTGELGVTLGDLATRAIDGGSAGREAGANLGSWLGKNIFRVDIERETLQRIRRVAAAAQQSLDTEARRYIERIDRLLTDADSYYATWTRASAQVAAAEESERMYDSLAGWTQEFLNQVFIASKIALAPLHINATSSDRRSE